MKKYLIMLAFMIASFVQATVLNVQIDNQTFHDLNKLEGYSLLITYRTDSAVKELLLPLEHKHITQIGNNAKIQQEVHFQPHDAMQPIIENHIQNTPHNAGEVVCQLIHNNNSIASGRFLAHQPFHEKINNELNTLDVSMRYFTQKDLRKYHPMFYTGNASLIIVVIPDRDRSAKYLTHSDPTPNGATTCKARPGEESQHPEFNAVWES